ncbi:MAG TPA: PEP-CTERM sorting domain-containing protein [Tepidisphaeraceae bacterium]|jgi:hypothetical protein|nr:PEP-CTERM sorting domain-containing protein [Tepidisphaeraceae bacterium]
MPAIRNTGIICVLAALSTAAHAQLVADGFTIGAGHYTAGSLYNGATGQNPFVPSFTSPWNLGTGSTTFQAATGSLTYSAAPYVTGGKINAVGTTTTIGTLARSFTHTSSTSYYMSVLCNRGNVTTIVPGAYSLLGWGNATTPNLGTSTTNLAGVYIGFSEVGAVSSGGTLDDFGNLVIRTEQQITSTTKGTVDTVLVDGQATSTYQQTYLVVAKLNVNDLAGGADSLTYWVNPTSLSSEAAMTSSALITDTIPTLAITTATDISRLEFAQDDFDGTASFDESRFGTSLANLTAVTPTPEPTSLLLLAIAGGFLRRQPRR